MQARVIGISIVIGALVALLVAKHLQSLNETVVQPVEQPSTASSDASAAAQAARAAALAVGKTFEGQTNAAMPAQEVHAPASTPVVSKEGREAQSAADQALQLAIEAARSERPTAK